MMDDLEVTAELFRIIRNNQDRPQKYILDLIESELKDATPEQIRRSFEYIVKKAV